MQAALASNVIDFPAQPARAAVMGQAREDDGAPDLTRFRREFSDFASVKAAEIDEAREAWAYYYGDQVPPELRKVWKDRGQPAIIFPMIDQVADGATGIIAEMRGDPKAFPRTPNNEQAAEVATQCVRAVLDESDWATEDTEAIRQAYVAGIAVAQLEFVEGDQHDDDVKVSRIDPRTFYYDPRSTEADFSDARFMGVSKWATADDVDEMFPGTSGDVQDAIDSGELTAFDADRDALWVQSRRRVRLVEHWYKEAGEWRYCFYAGSVHLASGASPYRDERGRTICRFIAFSNRIDQEGVHHGFHRRLKGPQDTVNFEKSKVAHLMASRRIKKRKGVGAQDLETTRREAARADGVLLYDLDPNEVVVERDDGAFLQHVQIYQDAKSQLERFGPTQIALGDGEKSGRALAMLMRAGMAQLGPFVTNLRGWRLRIYRALWAQVKNTWTNERIVRVTGDDDAPKFLAINQLVIGPMGMPQIANAVSSMNVDIIADEGPHTVNVLSDVFDLMVTLTQNKVPIPPAALIELSGLPGSIKRRLATMLSQPDPAREAGTKAEIENRNADTAHKLASAEHQTALARRETVGSHVDTVHALVGAPPTPRAAMQPPAAGF